MRVVGLTRWFAAIACVVAVGVGVMMLTSSTHVFAHAIGSILLELLVPALFMAHLADDFFEPRRARMVQSLAITGVLLLIVAVMMSALLPQLSMPLLHLRIWGYVALQLGIVLGVVMLGSTMAMNYLRVASGRFRGIVQLVMIALAATIPWVSWDVAAMLAVLLLSVRGATHLRGA